MESSQIRQNRRKRQAGVAVAIISEVAGAVEEGLPADAALARIFRRERGYGGRDRRYYSQAVFSYFRWRGWVKKLAPGQLEQQIAWALAIDPLTTEGDNLFETWDADIDSATARPLGAFNETTMAALELTPDDLMPDWLPGVMPDATSRLDFIKSCAIRPPTWLAVPEKSLEQFGSFLTGQGLHFDIDQRVLGAVAIHDRFHLESLEKHWGQAIQVQDIASQAVVRICDARPGETWLDVCAGSGGKSLGLARAVGSTGSVTALDIRPSVIGNLEKRAAAHGFANIRANVMDATSYHTATVYDGVLVDAPCSGLGTWPRNPDARWRTKLDDVIKAAQKQITLLEEAAKRVKPGGKLVYSICTLTGMEGLNIMQDFIARHRDIDFKSFPHPYSGVSVPGYAALGPDEGPGDGMFIACMNRSASAG